MLYRGFQEFDPRISLFLLYSMTFSLEMPYSNDFYLEALIFTYFLKRLQRYVTGVEASIRIYVYNIFFTISVFAVSRMQYFFLEMSRKFA